MQLLVQLLQGAKPEDDQVKLATQEDEGVKVAAQTASEVMLQLLKNPFVQLLVQLLQGVKPVDDQVKLFSQEDGGGGAQTLSEVVLQC